MFKQTVMCVKDSSDQSLFLQIICAICIYIYVLVLDSPHLGFWSGIFFLIAPFSDLCFVLPPLILFVCLSCGLALQSTAMVMSGLVPTIMTS